MTTMYAVRITERTCAGQKSGIVRLNTEKEARDTVEYWQSSGNHRVTATYIGKVRVSMGKVGSGLTNHDPKKRKKNPKRSKR